MAMTPLGVLGMIVLIVAATPRQEWQCSDLVIMQSQCITASRQAGEIDGTLNPEP